MRDDSLQAAGLYVEPTKKHTAIKRLGIAATGFLALWGFTIWDAQNAQKDKKVVQDFLAARTALEKCTNFAFSNFQYVGTRQHADESINSNNINACVKEALPSNIYSTIVIKNDRITPDKGDYVSFGYTMTPSNGWSRTVSNKFAVPDTAIGVEYTTFTVNRPRDTSLLSYVSGWEAARNALKIGAALYSYLNYISYTGVEKQEVYVPKFGHGTSFTLTALAGIQYAPEQTPPVTQQPPLFSTQFNNYEHGKAGLSVEEKHELKELASTLPKTCPSGIQIDARASNEAKTPQGNFVVAGQRGKIVADFLAFSGYAGKIVINNYSNTHPLLDASGNPARTELQRSVTFGCLTH